MHVEERLKLLVRLGQYMSSTDEMWQAAKQKAFAENHWFIPEFIDLAVRNVVHQFLQYEDLKNLTDRCAVAAESNDPKKIGLALAGNIPLVGFHDVLCTFLSGHVAIIKPSSKDTALIKHLVETLVAWNPEVAQFIQIQNLLKGCDAYIATGGNNTGRYFDYYFRNHPHIVRKARTSVAVLTGKETAAELEALADDVYLYFGLGCRNVTQLFVPEGYDFVPLLDGFAKYNWLSNHHKYKNNYDYNLALHLLNNKKFMTNGSILLIEAESPFSPISQLHYQVYTDIENVFSRLQNQEGIQCVVGSSLPFGKAQCPELTDFADGVDTMAFLKSLTVNEG